MEVGESFDGQPFRHSEEWNSANGQITSNEAHNGDETLCMVNEPHPGCTSVASLSECEMIHISF